MGLNSTLIQPLDSFDLDMEKIDLIKIDVEGMEEVVLKGISESIPAQFKIMIIFENWDPHFNFNKIKEYFSERQTSLLILSKYTQYKKNWKRLFGETQLLLTPLESSEHNVGDIVAQIGNLVDLN